MSYKRECWSLPLATFSAGVIVALWKLCPDEAGGTLCGDAVDSVGVLVAELRDLALGESLNGALGSPFLLGGLGPGTRLADGGTVRLAPGSSSKYERRCKSSMNCGVRKGGGGTAYGSAPGSMEEGAGVPSGK